MNSIKPIPKLMKRLVLKTPGENLDACKLSVEKVPVPVPKAGEILIQVIAAPINPSDYGVWVKEKSRGMSSTNR